jgi:hypothetical protein
MAGCLMKFYLTNAANQLVGKSERFRLVLDLTGNRVYQDCVAYLK